MGIPQESNAVFYHPLDDRWARTPGLKWSGEAGFGPGRIDGAMDGVPGTEIVDAGTTAAPGPDMAFSDGRRLVCAGTTGNPDYNPTATAGAVSADGSFSYGAPVVAAAHPAKEPRVCWLDSSRFVLAWLRDTSGDELWMRVGAVSGLDVTFGGSATQVASGVHNDSPYLQVAALAGGSTVVAAYVNTGGDAIAVAAGVSGSVVTPGSPRGFQSTGGPRIGPILPLGSARFVLTWQSYISAQYGKCEVGTLSGTDITLGGDSNWFVGESPYPDGQLLSGAPAVARVGGESDGRFAVVFGRRGAGMTDFRISARHAQVSGDSVGFGPIRDVDVFPAATSWTNQVAGQLQGDRFAVEYEWYNSNDFHGQRVATVVGSDISFGPRQSLPGSVPSAFSWLRAMDTALYVCGYYVRRLPVAGAVAHSAGLADLADAADLFGPVGASDPIPAAARLDGSTFVVCHLNAAGHGSAAVCAVTGDSASAGPGSEFLESAGLSKVAVCALGAASFVVCYQDGGDGDKGKAKVGVVSGTDITFGAAYQFLPSVGGYLVAVGLDGDRFAVASGTSMKVGTVSGLPHWNIAYGPAATLPFAPACAAGLDAARVAVSGAGTVLATVNGADITVGPDSHPPAFGTATRAIAVSADKVALFGGSNVAVGAVAGSAFAWGAAGALGGGVSGAGALDSEHFVVAYYAGGGNSSAKSGSVVGLGATFADARELAPAEGSEGNAVSVVRLSDTRAAFVHAFRPFVGDWGIRVRVGDVDYGGRTALSYFGGEAEHLASRADYNAIAALGEDTVVVAYKDGSAGPPAAKVGSLTGSSPSFGAAASPTANQASNISVAATDGSHFVMCFTDVGDGSRGKAVVGHVTGSTISYGSVREFNDEQTDWTAAAALDSGRVIVCYRSIGSPSGRAKVGTVAGTSLSFGAAADFSATCGEVSVAALDSARAAVCYRTGGGVGYAAVATVAGADVTFGPPALFSGSAGYVSCRALDSARFAVAYSIASGSGPGSVRIGTAAGTDISFGPPAEFAATATWISLAALDPSAVAACYADAAGHGAAKLGAVSGSTVEFGSAVEFLSAPSADWISAAALDPRRFAVAYRNGANSDHGATAVGVLGRDAHPTAAGGTRLAFAAWVGFGDPFATTTPPPGESDPPTVTGPIYERQTAVSGTSGEPDGTEVQVYVNGQPAGDPASASGGAWAAALGAEHSRWGNSVTARAKAAGLGWSDHSAPVGVTFPLDPARGPAYGFAANSSSELFAAAARLDGDRFIVCYTDDSGGSTGKCRVATLGAGGTPPGTAIAWGAEQAAPGIQERKFTVVALSATKVALAIAGNGGCAGYAGTVSGDAVAWGPPSGSPGYVSANTEMSSAALDGSRFAVAWADRSGPYYSAVAVGSVAGTDLTWGAAASLGAVMYPGVAAVGADKIVVAYSLTGSNGGYALVGTVTGTGVSLGTQSQYAAAPNLNAATTVVAYGDGSHFAVVWSDPQDSRAARCRGGTVSGSSIAWSSVTQFVEPTAGYGQNVGLGGAALVGTRMLACTVVANGDYSPAPSLTAKAGEPLGSWPDAYFSFPYWYWTRLHSPSQWSINSVQVLALGPARAVAVWGWHLNGYAEAFAL